MRSNALVCGHSFAGIVGSKPAKEMGIVSYECCALTGTESLQLTDLSSRGFLLSVFVSLFVVKRKNNPLYLHWVGTRKSEEEIKNDILSFKYVWPCII
jgi:hypothetical protein